jgi:hypothetical protein
VHVSSAVGGALLLVASLLMAPVTAAHEYVATVTLAEGHATLLGSSQDYQPAPGVWLHHCDIVETGADGFVQLETDDGGMMEVARKSVLVAHLPALHAQLPLVGPHFLIEGWVKITVPKRTKGLPHRIDTPLLSIVLEQGIAAVQVTSGNVRFFVESGQAVASMRGASEARTVVNAGSMYAVKAGQTRGVVDDHATPEFIAAMPRAFRDTLKPRLASITARNVTPQPAGDAPGDDERDLLAGDEEMRQACRRRH